MKYSERPAVGIDYDGTIADTNALKAAWIRRNLNLEVPPWKTDRTMCVPIIGLEQYERMSREVYSPEVSMQAQEVPGARAAIRALSTRYRVYVVTARNSQQIASSQAWLAKMGLSDYIEGHLSSAQRAPDGSRISKSQLCQDYNIRVLIDDDERHLRGVRAAGKQRHFRLRCILLKNGCDEDLALPEGIELASSWAEVTRLLGIQGEGI